MKNERRKSTYEEEEVIVIFAINNRVISDTHTKRGLFMKRVIFGSF